MPELRQRQPRVKCAAFLRFVRGKACCACAAPPRSQAAHLRMSSLDHSKRETGKGEKPDDRWTVPLCGRCHLDEQHRVGEAAFWDLAGIDPLAVASRLWAAFVAEHGEPKAVHRTAHKKRRVLVKPGRSRRKLDSRKSRSRSTRLQKRKIVSRGFPKGSRPMRRKQ